MFRITLAVIALVAGSTIHSVSADQDLDSLLGELTHGESNQELLSSELLPETPQIDELAPAPNQRFTSTHEHAESYGDSMSAPSLTPSYNQETSQPEMLAPVAEPTVNFNQYFAGGAGGDACAGGSSSVMPCGPRGSQCDAPAVCRPHVAPNLPAASSMIQYFQSDNNHSNVWAGFAAERQKRSDRIYTHTQGSCDCFTKSQGHCGCQNQCGCQHAASSCDTSPYYR